MSTDTPEQQPRIPGVRYRKVKRTRLVETTYNGETKLREQEFHEWVPIPPLNLDVVYLRAVITVAVFLTLVAVVWSTTAIGRLLGGLVPGHGWVGYLAATAFEIPWIACLVVQWILRFQPKRAQHVNVAGWIGLGVVVTAVTMDGHHLNMLAVGIIGAFVSIVAKGLWWVVLRLFRVDLSEDAAGWLSAKREELNVTRVMLDEQQRMAGQQAYLNHIYGLTAPTATMQQLPAAPMTALSGQPPAVSVPVSGQPSTPTVEKAPPPAATSAPPAVPTVPVQPPSAPVETVAPATAQQAGSQPPAGAPAPPLHAVGGAPTIAGTVREVLTDTPDITDHDLIARVGKVHGDGGDPVKFADTVTRTRRRIEKKQKRNAS